MQFITGVKPMDKSGGYIAQMDSMMANQAVYDGTVK